MTGTVQPQLCANTSSFWEAQLSFTGMLKSARASLPLSFLTIPNVITSSWQQKGNIVLHCNHFYALSSWSSRQYPLHHLKPIKVLRKVLKQNVDYRFLVCCPLYYLTRWLSMCVSKSFCNTPLRCNLRYNLLLAIFFWHYSFPQICIFQNYIWFNPTIHVRFFSFLQDNSVHVATRLAVTQASMEMMASLQVPFKSTCHLINQ